MSTALRAQLASDLAEAGCAPLHRFGQNFMIDAGALDALRDALGATAGMRVVEVGPGTGLFTARLLAAGCTVLAVEIDRGLAAFLRQRFVPLGLELVEGDCLESKDSLHPAITAFAASGPWNLAANLPYDVALPVILDAAAMATPPRRIAVTIQLEAAQRLCSRPGEPAWGATACTGQAAGQVRIVRRLGPGSFHPRPRVDSAIVLWEPSGIPLPRGFPSWCRKVFSFRRKVLPRALRDAGLAKELADAACTVAGIDPTRRLEQLDSAEMLALHAAVAIS